MHSSYYLHLLRDLYFLHFLQVNRSQYERQLREFPCPFKEREALNRLLPLCKINTTSTISQKCAIMADVVHGIYNEAQIEMSFQSKMIILTVLAKISRCCFTSDDQFNDLSGVIHMRNQISSIRQWITYLEFSLEEQDLGFYETRITRNCLICRSYHIESLYDMLTQRIDILSQIRPTQVIRNLQNNFEEVMFLTDEESLNRCPGLKDKLASSTKTLVDAAADDSCSVCLGSNVSSEEDFAILDACVHLFCKRCISRWFTTA